MKPLVSALIVNFNGKSVVGEAINAVRGQSYSNIEIIIVDNNSADGSRQYIAENFKGAVIVQNRENLGYSGINAGIKSCRGKYIFFTNNDISLSKGCIRKLVECLEEDGKAGIACPKIVNYFDRNMESCGTWLSRAFYSGHFRSAKDCRKEIPYLGVGLIRKEIVEKFEYIFDSDYFIYAEDVDLGLRARLLGYKAVHIPEAVMYHMHQHTVRKSRKSRLTYLMEKNLLSTFIKIMQLKNIILFLPYVLAIRLAAVLKDLLTFRLGNAGARVLAVFAVIGNLPHLIRKRRKVQKLRKMDDSFLLEVFSEKYLFSRDKINV